MNWRRLVLVALGAGCTFLFAYFAFHDFLYCRAGAGTSDCQIMWWYSPDVPWLTALLTTLFVVAGAWILLGRPRELEKARINDSATSIALAALVEPLLRLNLVMLTVESRSRKSEATPSPSQADEAGRSRVPPNQINVPDAGKTHDQALTSEQLVDLVWDRSRGMQENRQLKWCREFLRHEIGKVPPLVEESQTAGGERRLDQLVEEGIHAIVARVRDWSDLLVLTSDGQAALYCLQSLRVELQDLEQRMRDVQAVPPQEGNAGSLEDWNSCSRMAKRIQQHALLMACSFELASCPVEPRDEVKVALKNWSHTSSGSAIEQDDRRDTYVHGEIGDLAALVSATTRPSHRFKSRSRAWKSIRGLKREQMRHVRDQERSG